MPKLLWEYLRTLPAPLADNELAKLARQGFIQKIRNVYHLTPTGNTALARTSVAGEQSLLSSGDIAYLQSLTFLPSLENLKILGDATLIANKEGQMVLTLRGLVAKSELSSGAKYSRRLQNSLDSSDEDGFEPAKY